MRLVGFFAAVDVFAAVVFRVVPVAFEAVDFLAAVDFRAAVGFFDAVGSFDDGIDFLALDGRLAADGRSAASPSAPDPCSTFRGAGAGSPSHAGRMPYVHDSGFCAW